MADVNPFDASAGQGYGDYWRQLGWRFGLNDSPNGQSAPAVAQPAAAPAAMGLSAGWRQRMQQQQPMMRLGAETPGAQTTTYPPSALQQALNGR